MPAIIIATQGQNNDWRSRKQKYNTEIIKLSINDDISQARNHLIKNCNTFWHFVIEPWEYLAETDEISNSLFNSPEVYKANVLQGDILTKEIRFWHLSKNIIYENPVYETVKSNGQELGLYLFSQGGKRTINTIDILNKWQTKSPLSPDPIYYRALTELIQKNWDAFLNYADLFVHMQKKQDISYFMTLYYTAMVLCYIKKDYQKAIQNLSLCIIKNPTMAEFWCLLGDIYYATNEFKKASCFYDNARLLGSRRLNKCEFPMEISKYKEYPEKMIAACESSVNNMNVYAAKINKQSQVH